MDAMNFHESQRIARRQSSFLLLLFSLAVIALCLVSMLVVGAAMGLLIDENGQLDLLSRLPDLLPVAGLILVVVTIGSLKRWYSFKAGGAAVARALGGVEVHPETRDPAERRLRNVVEEMALAAALPVPGLYLLPEQGINAFAAGHGPEDAVIGVTRGAVEHFSRDELEGVIAHEFSHIRGGDMARNLNITALLGGIFAIGVLGYLALRLAPALGGGGRSRNSKGSQGGAMIAAMAAGVGLMAIGGVGMFFGRWIQASLNRQREYLADASAAQFTRNPDGLARALVRIRDLDSGSRVKAKHAGEYSHFFFAAGLKGGLSSLFATHPPIDERIRRLDPDGSEDPRLRAG